MFPQGLLAGSLFWLLCGIGIILGSITTLAVGTLRNPGPGFVPFLMGCLLTILSTIQVLKEARSGKRSRDVLWVDKDKLLRLFLTLAAMVAYTRVTPFLGFILATAFLMIFLFKAVAGFGWKGSMAGAAIVAFSAYLIFEIALKVQFPEGFWQG